MVVSIQSALGIPWPARYEEILSLCNLIVKDLSKRVVVPNVVQQIHQCSKRRKKPIVKKDATWMFDQVDKITDRSSPEPVTALISLCCLSYNRVIVESTARNQSH